MHLQVPEPLASFEVAAISTPRALGAPWLAAQAATPAQYAGWHDQQQPLLQQAITTPMQLQHQLQPSLQQQREEQRWSQLTVPSADTSLLHSSRPAVVEAATQADSVDWVPAQEALQEQAAAQLPSGALPDHGANPDAAAAQAALAAQQAAAAAAGQAAAAAAGQAAARKQLEQLAGAMQGQLDALSRAVEGLKVERQQLRQSLTSVPRVTAAAAAAATAAHSGGTHAAALQHSATGPDAHGILSEGELARLRALPAAAGGDPAAFSGAQAQPPATQHSSAGVSRVLMQHMYDAGAADSAAGSQALCDEDTSASWFCLAQQLLIAPKLVDWCSCCVLQA